MSFTVKRGRDDSYHIFDGDKDIISIAYPDALLIVPEDAYSVKTLVKNALSEGKPEAAYGIDFSETSCALLTDEDWNEITRQVARLYGNEKGYNTMHFSCTVDSSECVLHDHERNVDFSLGDPADEIFEREDLSGKEIAENIDFFADSTINSLYEESRLGIVDESMDISRYSIIERTQMKTAIRKALQEKYLPERTEKKSLSDIKKAVSEKRAAKSKAIYAPMKNVLMIDKPAYLLMSNDTFTTVHKAEDLGEADDALGRVIDGHFDERCPDVKLALSYFDNNPYNAAKNILLAMTANNFNFAAAEDAWEKVYEDNPSRMKHFDVKSASEEELKEEIKDQAWKRVNELKALKDSHDGILREADVNDYFPDLYHMDFSIDDDLIGTELDPESHLGILKGEDNSYILMVDLMAKNAYAQLEEAGKQYEDYLDNNLVITKSFSENEITKVTFGHDIDPHQNIADFVNETLGNDAHAKLFLGFYDDPAKAANLAMQYMKSGKEKSKASGR